ncbi:MAG: double-strand break repair helicase AddA [Alphaproteobacteria bacterium]|nr:double-strand break repair helicase AddA [Alphaproteobacteria bacterium]
MTRDPPSRQPDAVQGAASSPETSAWVAASAGSGKTKVLTDRVLRLLLNRVRPHRIVCLTYTKIAASEMLDRIMRSLRLWSDCFDAELEQRLHSLLGAAPKDEQLVLARKLYGILLNSASGLKIQTIHSFCESLLGRFPIEAGVPPNFKIIDSLTAALLLNRAKNGLISAVENEPDHPLKKDLARLIGTMGEWGFGFDNRNAPLKLFLEFKEQFFALMAGDGLGRWAETLAAELGVDATLDEESLKLQAMSEAFFPAEALRRTLPIFAQGSPTVDQKMLESLTSFLEQSPDQRITAFDGYAKILLTQAGTPRKDAPTKGLLKSHPGPLAIITSEKQRIYTATSQLGLHRRYHNTVALMRVGGAILQSYQLLKQQQLRLDFDDLILKTRTLLEMNNGVSWVMYKLDQGIDHLLVDEAQDSNEAQWAIIAKIVEEFFTSDGDPDPTRQNRSVFIVGDRKQSIYSFQGAEVQAFDATALRFRRLAADYQIPWRGENFDFSFRSTPPILELVDRVFNALPRPNGVLLAAEPTLRHHSQRRDTEDKPLPAGRVEIWPLIQTETPAEPAEWEIPDHRNPTFAGEAILATLLVKRIRYWLDNRTPLPTSGKPIAPGDIMILVQRRKTLARLILRELKQARIPVAGADREQLGEVLAVKDILALIQFVILPTDDLTLAALLKSPLVGLSEEGLFDLAHHRSHGQSLWDSLRAKAGSQPAYQAAVTSLSDWLDHADFSPPLEFVSRVLTEGEGRRRLLQRLGTEMEEPIAALLQLLQNYEDSETPSLQGFLSWFNSGSSEIVRKSDRARDEVRIMTVHGAKGLQAPIVILPDTTTEPRSNSAVYWHEKFGLLHFPKSDPEPRIVTEARDRRKELEKHENHRLLYVALTRAEEWLILCGHQKPSESPSDAENESAAEPTVPSNWYELIQASCQDFGEPWTLQEDPAFATPEVQRLLATTLPAAVPGRLYQGATPAARAATAATPLPPEPPLAEPLPAWVATRPAEPNPQFFPAPLRPSWEEVIPSPPPTAASILAAASASLSPALAGNRRLSPFKRGNLIHRLLQFLPHLPMTERHQRMNQFLDQIPEPLTAEERSALLAEVTSVLHHPDFAEVFAPHGLAEVPITGQIGKFQVNGRIDRLVVTPSSVLLVDYKSDRHPPTNLAAINPNYLKQIAAYRAIVQLLYPNQQIRIALLWTETPQLQEIPDETLQPFAPFQD